MSFLMLLAAVLLAVRLPLVYSMYGRALDETSRRSREIIDQGGDDQEFLVPYTVLRAHSFNLDMLRVWCWTYDQFFPDIAEAPRHE